jgi:hypothetical protein
LFCALVKVLLTEVAQDNAFRDVQDPRRFLDRALHPFGDKRGRIALPVTDIDSEYAAVL